MSYVDHNLMEGEAVRYRTQRHWVIYCWPAVLLSAGLALFIASRIVPDPHAPDIGNWLLGVAAGVALLMAIPSWIERRTSEFAVTNKRVIVKVGWIKRRSLETLLSKIEAMEVIQGVWARLLGYGTIIIIGTGGTKEPFERITAPLEFRRKVQEQILAMQKN